VTDYYEVLGVPRGATLEEIKKAKRREASKHHPDRGGDATKMAQINRAYEVLSDKETRERYDLGGEEAVKPQLTLDEAARNLLIGLFNQMLHAMIDQCMPFPKLLSALHQGVDHAQEQEQRRLSALRDGLATLQRQKKRLRRKDKQATFFEDIIAGHIDQCSASIEALEKTIASNKALWKRARELLKEHAEDPEAGMEEFVTIFRLR
jgi:curved DNA-binding protein CbpA